MTALHKKGPTDVASNYRPISLTSVPCKILERMVRRALTIHLDEHDLIAKEQHGFVAKKSCTTNLLETVDCISQALAKKKPVDVIYLDFAKAFDKVSHRLLLYKLAKYGIQDRLLAWIGDFLSMRRQHVVLGDTCSDWTSVKSGVPQGSVLGPTLFAHLIKLGTLTYAHSLAKLYEMHCL